MHICNMMQIRAFRMYFEVHLSEIMLYGLILNKIMVIIASKIYLYVFQTSVSN